MIYLDEDNYDQEPNTIMRLKGKGDYILILTLWDSHSILDMSIELKQFNSNLVLVAESWKTSKSFTYFFFH